MKSHRMALCVALVSLLLAGCSTTSSTSNHSSTSVRIAETGTKGINVTADKIDESTFFIVAYGKDTISQDDFMKAWVWMAEKTAAGRPYEKKNVKFDRIDYGWRSVEAGGVSSVKEDGTKVSGQITLLPRPSL